MRALYACLKPGWLLTPSSPTQPRAQVSGFASNDAVAQKSCSALATGCKVGSCATGSVAIALDASVDQICVLNQAGLAADGTPCAAGSYTAAVGSGSCAPCAAGYYSTDGSSACQPCTPGSVATSDGASECTACAGAQLPAMSVCPTCSASYAAVKLASAPDFTSTSIPSTDNAPALSACSTTTYGLTINDDCSVVLAPLGDALCSNPSNNEFVSAQLSGYQYDASTFMAEVPSTVAGHT